MEVWQQLTVLGRLMMSVGLISNAWGVGALVDALTRRARKS
jgi:hypothetical protein